MSSKRKHTCLSRMTRIITQAMSQRIDRRFANWQGLHIDKDTVEPDELARAFMDYLDCECTYFPSMSDDDPIMSAYTYAQRLGVREGFIPVLVNVDEGLWENIIGNSDPDSESSDDYTFNREKVNEFRRRLLEAPVMDGKSILDKLTGRTTMILMKSLKADSTTTVIRATGIPIRT